MTIHDFDMARFLTGSEVDEIFVMAGVMVDPIIGEMGDVDTATILLHFRSGVIGTIENCRRVAKKSLEQPRPVLLSEIDVDFKSLLRALNRIGYTGPLSCEWEDSGMDREWGAQDALAFVRQIDFSPSTVSPFK